MKMKKIEFKKKYVITIIVVLIVLLSFVIPVRKEEDTLKTSGELIICYAISETTYYNIYNMKIITVQKAMN